MKQAQSGRERPVGDTVHDGTPQVTAPADVKAQDNHRIGDLADLDEAVKVRQEAVTLSAPDHPNLARRIWELGQTWFALYGRSKNPEDLDIAIDLGQRAVSALPPGDTNRSAMLLGLRDFLLARFNLVKERADLDAAETAERLAREGARPTGSAGDRNLADLANLEEALGDLRQDIAASPGGDPDGPGRWLLLMTGMFSRFSLAGDPADLDAAIEVGEQAIAALPSELPDERFALMGLLTLQP